MEYTLTPSQTNFYTDESFSDIPIWNQGVIALFPHSYSYEQLNDAFNCMIETHEQLRMLCISHSDNITSHIIPFHPVQYPFRSFSSQKELMDFAQNYVNEPLDYFQELFRCILVSIPGKTGFLVCAHHILIDGFCSQIMGDFLEHFLQNQKPFSIPLQSYAEHMTADTQYLSTIRYQKDLEYWKTIFSKKPVCNVFFDKNNSANYSCREYRTTVSAELFREMESFCKLQKIYPSTLFYTALAGYIQRECGYYHFNIGMPVFNRTSRAESNTIGLYMHVLPLNIHLTKESFLINANAIEREKFKLLRHSKLTQNQMIPLLYDTENHTSSLFDVVLNYQPFSGNTGYELIFPYSNALSTALEIHIHNISPDDHQVIIRYRTSCFSGEEIRILWNRVINIIHYAMKHSETPIQHIPQYNLSSKERQELLFDLNNTSYDYGLSADETIYSLFERTALNNKDRICLTAGASSFTFGEFLTYTQALDAKVRKITGGKKSVIAILAERSPEMYTAIYAAIRGGNAYLPISPDDPPERIQFLLEDSGAALILAQGSFAKLSGNVPAIDVTDFLHIHSFKEKTSDDEIFSSLAAPDDAAYIIYTSGSTGKPKGAKISHRSLINRILWMQDSYPTDKHSVILQKTPYTFDVSLWEIFLWGICGCSMAASNPGEHFLPAKILEAIKTYQVTHLHFVPSVFDLFLTYMKSHQNKCESFSSVKHVFLSGETLSASLVQRFYSLFSKYSVQLHNLYGPTECTVDVTSYDCTPEDIDPIPIGKPIYNTNIYILDSRLELLPKGMMGELCISGINVGQGYINNPELTAEKFVQNPFSSGIIYRTGDYARIREDGQIIFCGRMDGQRKLNGQRIELGEIEAVIQQIEDVETAVADIRKHAGQELLTVYYCGNTTETFIKEYCQSKLPPYMVPTLFFHLEQMPLTPNGKLNRQQLANLQYASSLEPIFETAQNAEEAYVFDAFHRILQVNSIGRYSNFFTLGGTSLSMIELLSEEPFENVSASDFIKDPTPAFLVKCLKQDSLPDVSTRLFSLRENTVHKYALIAFPYAGGGPESYAELKLAADHTSSELNIYYIDYPKNFEECVHIVNELETLSEKYTLFFYSHCAGSAAALQVLHILEERKCPIIKHYIAGANIPSKVPTKENMWQTIPDSVLKNILIKSGASFDTLSEIHIANMLTKFRMNTDFYTEYFYKTSGKIHCPFSLVLSKQDLFTENYDEASIIWNRYVESISSIHYIADSSHYFQSSSAKELLQIILKIINKQ